MKNYTLFLLFLSSMFLLNCSDDDNFENFPSDAVTYKVTFNLNWNSTDFPTDFPSNAHFSKLIGWSHQSTTFFQPSTLASAGIKNMAETGGTSPLDAEIKTRIEQNEGLDRVIGSGLSGTGVGTISIEIVVHKDYPYVTLATMLAPSPDWYAATVSTLLYENNTYVDQLTKDIIVYDAGTDSGDSFASPDAVTSPQAAISVFVAAPLGDGNEVSPAIGTVTFEKL